MAHLERFNTGRQTRRGPQRDYDAPLQITIDSESVTEQYLRNLEKDEIKIFNDKLRAWGNKVRDELKSSVRNTVSVDKHLSESIRSNVYVDSRIARNDDYEINKLGFSFRAEGVYVQLGVGRGYYRSGGSTLKRNSIQGLRRNQPRKERVPKDWFNTVIQRNMGEIETIVSEYSENLVINFTRIFINS